MKPKPQRRYPRRPIVPPPSAIEGQFIVTSVMFDRDIWTKSARVELLSNGPFALNHFPTRPVNIVEVP